MATPNLVFGRRTALLAAAALAPSVRSWGQSAPASAPVTPELIAAAGKEGTVVWHTSVELALCEKINAAFVKRYSGMRVQLERTGAERILQRITQEYSSGIFASDVVESSDGGMFLGWKRQGMLAAYVPEDVAKLPKEERDADGRFASFRANLSVLGYNTKQITKAEDVPRGFADLLNPRWRMRLVKAHPSYSGTILASTYATVQAMGWEYFEKLAKQRVMQVQSASETPKKISQGERTIQVDGSEYTLLTLMDQGEPVKPIYAVEGTPILSGPVALMEKAAHPNAARLFASFLFSAECQQLIVDVGNLRSFHPEVKEKPSHVKLSDIKLLHADPVALEKAAEEVKRKYSEIFGV